MSCCVHMPMTISSRLLLREPLGLGELPLDLGDVVGVELGAHLAECVTGFGRGHRILRKLDADEAHAAMLARIEC